MLTCDNCDKPFEVDDDVQVGEQRCLRTDVAAAHRIVNVATDCADAVVLDLDLDSTGGFAEGTDRECHRSLSSNGIV